MANQSLVKRAITALRQEFKRQPPEGPDLGRQNYGSPFLGFSSWGWDYVSRSRTDYRNEVGGLDGNSLAMAVVNFTSLRIPEAKPCVIRTTKQGDEEKDFLHPAAQLIRRPNRFHIWANYAASCSMAWWFSGNVYFYKVRDQPGQVIELWNLPYFLVEPRWPNDGRSPAVPQDANNDPFLSHYEYRIPGKTPVLYPANDILHIKRGSDPARPRLGLGAFESLFKELYGDDKMALFTASIMKNMGIQVPVISPKDDSIKIDEGDALHMKESWLQKTTGARAGEPVIMTEPINIEKFGFNPTELDLSALRLIPESRVCAVCQISPAALQLMVGITNGTSYASSEQARQQGYEEVIIPIQQAWAEEFTWQLLPEFEGSEGMEFSFDTSRVRVLEEDKDALVKRESETFRTGGTTIDQYLMSIGKKPVGAPLGDVRYIPSLASPMSPDRLLERATTEPQAPPVAPIDPASLAKFVEMERMFEGLEEQMKEFNESSNP